MSTEVFRGRLRAAPRPEGAAMNQPLRYRLGVAAAAIVDVVQCAGGWLFDRGSVGWDVVIHTDGRADPRPLQILGVRAVSQDSYPALIPPELTALAVAGSVVASDAGLRDAVLEELKRGLTEITLWADTLPAGMAHGLNRVQHRLSAAARAFKAHALAAAGAGDAAVGPTETFWSHATTGITLTSDLIPAPQPATARETS